jgi:hypothetical protein
MAQVLLSRDASISSSKNRRKCSDASCQICSEMEEIQRVIIFSHYNWPFNNCGASTVKLFTTIGIDGACAAFAIKLFTAVTNSL